MKNILTILFMMVAISVSAQQRYKGQWSTSVSGGINTNNSYCASIAAETYRGYSSAFGITVSMLNSRYRTSNNFNFDVRQILAGMKYVYSFNLVEPVFINIGAGLLLGYENPPARTIENKYLKYGSKFNVGFDVAPQVEVILSKHISLFAEPRLMYIFTTNFENFIATGAVGLKLYF